MTIFPLGDEPLRSLMLGSISGVIHGITHRVEGMGAADGNVGDTPPRDAEDAWEMRRQWASRIGFDPDCIVRTGQVHEARVFRVETEHKGSGKNRWTTTCETADAMMTDQPNLALMTLHADCLPLLLVDPAHHAIAAVHAGWRGTNLDIAGKTIDAMHTAYGTRPKDVLAWLGPAIGVCCNEVGPEVTGQWREQAADLGPLAEVAVRRPEVKEHFDVPRANALLLQRAGVLPHHIEISAICTKCNTDEWFSHRGHGPDAGRQGALIMLTGEPMR